MSNLTECAAKFDDCNNEFPTKTNTNGMKILKLQKVFCNIPFEADLKRLTLTKQCILLTCTSCSNHATWSHTNSNTTFIPWWSKNSWPANWMHCFDCDPFLTSAQTHGPSDLLSPYVASKTTLPAFWQNIVIILQNQRRSLPRLRHCDRLEARECNYMAHAATVEALKGPTPTLQVRNN